MECFFFLNNANIQFADKNLIWRTYRTKEALPTTRRIKLINKKKFAEKVLNENVKAFIVHVASLSLKMTIYPARKAWITLLLVEKVTVLEEYLDFADVFSKK